MNYLVLVSDQTFTGDDLLTPDESAYLLRLLETEVETENPTAKAILDKIRETR